MEERGKLVLSLNAALTGEITANMRAVLVRRKGKEIQIRFIFYKPPNADEIEAIGIVGTETLADFKDDTGSESYEVSLGGKIDLHPGEYVVFQRKDEPVSAAA